MKKLIAILLLTVMCFTLVACGGNNTPDGDKNSNASKKDYKAIEITMDNWEQYFELVSKYEVLDESNVQITHTFQIKPELAGKTNVAASSIAPKISYELGIQNGTFAADLSSFEPTGEFSSYGSYSDIAITFSNTGVLSEMFGSSFAGASEINDGKIDKYFKNLKLTDISGTLSIAE